jgi:hypothetical protein
LIPPTGDYLVTTTWRDVLNAAMTVGRDVTPWLAALPQLARMEIIARHSPLRAYLHRAPRPALVASAVHSTGRVVVPNDVYTHGTEITARGAFSYRVGMTMTEWVCRGWLGLGPTIHAESAVPPGADPVAWDGLASKPDLFGLHSQHPRTWLIEAKAARKLYKPKLTKGTAQLEAGGRAHGGAHTKVLCGTSLEEQLFVTVDIESADGADSDSAYPPAPEEPDIADDEGTLYAAARSRMLTYLFLTSVGHANLWIAPISRQGASSRGAPNARGGGGLSMLEFDTQTRAVRDRLAAASSSNELTNMVRRGEAVDLLTAAVPGTDIAIGMSRRLFGACASLANELQSIAIEADLSVGLPQSQALESTLSADDLEFEGARQERLRRFREIEDDRRQRLYVTARRGFQIGEAQTWSTLMDVSPASLVPSITTRLEGATLDAYFAIDAASAASQ